MSPDIFRQTVVSMSVDAASFQTVSALVLKWIDDPRGRYVCVSNVHMCIECLDNPAFADVVNSADLVVPDGKPIALALKLLGHESVEQIRGADLTEEILKYADFKNAVIGFYGGTETALARIRETLIRDYPGIKIGCMISPPFRTLTEVELADDRKLINESGTQLLFVGLGCPKQE
ncbi:MAG: WecB/TagA/CpsF family glycosyltransferase, partial [Nitrospirales bacterium]